MVQYLQLVEDILRHGKSRQSQKAMGTRAILGRQVRYNLADGFPLLTTRDLSGSWKALVGELLWIMSGSTNANDLHQYGTKLWDRWAQASAEKLGMTDGNLGPTYGHQMRNFAGKTDQLKQVSLMLKRDPHTRRAMISYWNLGDVEDIDGKHIVDVAPCITLMHFVSIEDGILDLHMVQRSADVPVGVPFDVAEYALLLTLMSQEVGLKPGTLVHTMSDAHIYNNQIPSMEELLTRKPLPLPKVTILPSPTNSMFDHRPEDFVLENYQSHPKMKIEVET
jgi:thymidylate synthase